MHAPGRSLGQATPTIMGYDRISKRAISEDQKSSEQSHVF